MKLALHIVIIPVNGFFVQILDHVSSIHKSIIDFLYIGIHSSTYIILSMSSPYITRHILITSYV